MSNEFGDVAREMEEDIIMSSFLPKHAIYLFTKDTDIFLCIFLRPYLNKIGHKNLQT